MARILHSADCLNVLNDELALPSGSVDLIYLDPPFNSKNHYNLPFTGKDKDTRPVEAFHDTWGWGTEEDALLRDLSGGPVSHNLAEIVQLAQRLDRTHGGSGEPKHSLAAYLVNMAVRLIPMRRVLATTGTIYLHCDPTASHYLKLVMDAIFGQRNFQNEIIWCYRGGGAPKKDFGRRHDVILRYAKSDKYHFVPDAVRVPYQAEGIGRTDDAMWGKHKGTDKIYKPHPLGKVPEDWWPMNILNANDPERLGYPTQKPLALIERIIKASSNPGDVVLDPFCGCGTTTHAAEKHGRPWVGVDVSAFAIELIRDRILSTFKGLTIGDIAVHGVPTTIAEAEALAARDKFEFEKWVCGAIGAEGMFKEPGTRGADGGVDGVLKFVPIHWDHKPKAEYAIVQVKGGGGDGGRGKEPNCYCGALRREGRRPGVLQSVHAHSGEPAQQGHL